MSKDREYEVQRALRPRDTRPRCKHCDTVLLFDKPWCKKNGRHIGDNQRLCLELRGERELKDKLAIALSDAQRLLLAAGIAR